MSRKAPLAKYASGAICAVLLLCACGTPPPQPAAAAARAAAQFVSYPDARSIVDAHASALPAELKGKRGAELEAAWPQWAAAHDAAIRARLARGDEDSVVNFWLYGTTFTEKPRATRADLARRGAARAEDLLIARLDDLVAAMANPGANERVRLARQVVERHGVDLATEAGQDKARELLVGLRARMIDETKQHASEAQAASARGRGGALDTYATMFRERGLSSDTSIAVNFALDRAVEALAAQQALARGSVRRVAIVGPGLDFTDKADGYDVYPVQTIQPFALIESLLRHQLSTAAALRVTTFDLSPRVNEHLRGAVARAKSGEPYVLQLPLARDDPSHTWEASLDQYWRTCGNAIGKETTPVAVPAAAGRVDLRAIAVRPEIAASISPMDLDVVVQRLAPLAEDEKFDLIVATNVLLYYDPFEQSLALANVGSMLRPGGVFLTNYQVHPPPPFEGTASVVTPVFWDAQKNGDTMFGYRFAAGGRP